LKWSFSMKVVGVVLATVLFLSGTTFGLTYPFVSEAFDAEIPRKMKLPCGGV
jgi:hypothetical protein